MDPEQALEYAISADECLPPSVIDGLKELRDLLVAFTTRRGLGVVSFGSALSHDQVVHTEEPFVADAIKHSKLGALYRGADPVVVAVYQHWLVAYGKDPDRTPLTIKRAGAIGSALVDGIDGECCISWINDVGQTPQLIGRSACPDLTTLFRPSNLKKLRKHYGLPEPKKVTWMTGFMQVWQKHYPDSEFPFGYASKPLKGVYDRLGESVVLPDFDAYCARTEVDYVNFNKYAAVCPNWAAQPNKGSRIGGTAAQMPSNKPVTTVRE